MSAQQPPRDTVAEFQALFNRPAIQRLLALASPSDSGGLSRDLKRPDPLYTTFGIVVEEYYAAKPEATTVLADALILPDYARFAFLMGMGALVTKFQRTPTNTFFAFAQQLTEARLGGHGADAAGALNVVYDPASTNADARNSLFIKCFNNKMAPDWLRFYAKVQFENFYLGI